VIDGATDSVVATLPVGALPIDLACNPSWSRVYVANYQGSSISVLRDTGGGIQETMSDERVTMNSGATVVRGLLLLPAATSAVGAALFDVDGREVMPLLPGPNDVSRLASGVYFVQEAQAQGRARAARLVVITR